MVYSNELLIVIDPGHGGWDNGASWQGRLEKDDNLRLGLEVQKQLRAQCINVLMTRDTDVYVTLADRAAMANQADADLFVSLHRNSYIEHTPTSNGVENFIYLTAPAETSGRAAQYVLDSVVDVGVQSNRGVGRGNYYVLRRTIMPAMLLEMGFIIDEIDNELFDEHLLQYAAAIAKGIMQYFGLEFVEIPGVVPPLPPTMPPPVFPGCPAAPTPLMPPICAVPPIELPPVHPIPPVYPVPPIEPPIHPMPPIYPVPPVCPVCPTVLAFDTQRMVNERFNLSMPISGIFDEATNKAMVKALQMALNNDFNACLAVDGILGPKTLAAFPNVFPGQRGNVVFVLQALLNLNGYDAGGLDGIFGIKTKTAVQTFQRDHFITPDGVVRQPTLKALFGM